MTRKIAFEPEFQLNPKTGKLHYFYRPYLFVKLKNGKRTSENLIKSLVDSGSDHNIFPAEFAIEVGISYKKGMFVRPQSSMIILSWFTQIMQRLIMMGKLLIQLFTSERMLKYQYLAEMDSLTTLEKYLLM